MDEFETGDIVRLKSGGPEMTVSQSATGGRIRCQWFAGKKLEFGDFQPSSLVLVQDNDSE